jgi:hypothetical protein
MRRLMSLRSNFGKGAIAGNPFFKRRSLRTTDSGRAEAREIAY